MKLFSFLVMFLLSYSLVGQKTEHYTKPLFEMTFENPHQDFGKVKQGEKRSTEFVFTNTGQEDIRIELVSACECTTLDWPRKAIKSGEKGSIEVIFDSTEKEESETIEVDINLKNIDPKTGYSRLEIVSYKYELIPKKN